MHYLILFAILLLVAITGSSADAQKPRTPPSEAFTACEKASDGQQCTVKLHNRSLEGSCRIPPQLSRLVCVPLEHPLHSRGQAVDNNANRPQASHPARVHTITQSNGELETVPANTNPISSSEFLTVNGSEQRLIEANGISEHLTGQFPNTGNPNTIREQHYRYLVPLKPTPNQGGKTQVWGYNFGIALNGVPFDPGASEWFRGERGSIWQYAALSGAISLGLDDNHAHVQPSGAYHYHGTPSGLLENIGIKASDHSPIIGWAADGYPIYALYGFKDATDASSPVVELTSSYSVKSGNRPGDNNQPGGVYDGTFTADYEYLGNAGTLDECNGRYTVTPEFPQGSYAYFLSTGWPVIPRCFMGQPDASFRKFRV